MLCASCGGVMGEVPITKGVFKQIGVNYFCKSMTCDYEIDTGLPNAL